MSFKSSYNKKWKKLMILPVLILIVSLGILGNNYSTFGDFIEKDASLKGGYSITIETEKEFSPKEVENILGEDISVKKLRSIATGSALGYTIDYGGDNIDSFLIEVESLFGVSEYGIEEISPAISQRFWEGTLKAISGAIIAMSLVVFLYFRKVVPALAIVLSGISNIIGTLAAMSLIGISLSASGIAAILMLLGYSIDSNIVLTARVMKNKKDSLEDRITSAVKTGLTMSVTSIAALTVLYLTSTAEILKIISLTLI
ncbi:uncharacterized protein METZ01_LOCUS298638, partial [marine metagenome]